MRRKEVLFAVIGGIVGAVLTIFALQGSFSPLGAQNEGKDVEFGTITCRRIEVVDSVGNVGVEVSIDDDNGGGNISVVSKNGRDHIHMSAEDNGVRILGFGEQGMLNIGVSQYGGGFVIVTGDTKTGELGSNGLFPE